MDRSTMPRAAALDIAPLHRDAQAPADYLARAGIADWQQYLAGGGEIQRTLLGDCRRMRRDHRGACRRVVR